MSQSAGWAYNVLLYHESQQQYIYNLKYVINIINPILFVLLCLLLLLFTFKLALGACIRMCTKQHTTQKLQSRYIQYTLKYDIGVTASIPVNKPSWKGKSLKIIKPRSSLCLSWLQLAWHNALSQTKRFSCLLPKFHFPAKSQPQLTCPCDV